MTVRLLSQCSLCEHFRPPLGGGKETCAAFPDGIPGDVLDNERDHRKSIPGDHGVTWKPHNGAAFPAESFKSYRRRVRRKHLPGQHNQDAHGHHGSRVLDALDSLDVLEGDEYWSRHGDEMYSETTPNGLSPRLFESGDMELALDLGDDKFQALGDFDEPDQMRQLASDIDKVLNLDLDDYEEGDEDEEGIVDRVSDISHGFTIGRYSNGDVRVESTAGEFEPFDISEEDADELAEALKSVAEVFDENFEIGSSGSKSARTRSAMNTTMAVKAFNPTVKAVGQKGEGTATIKIASFGEVDKDGDVTQPGFFGTQHVQFVPTHNWDHVWLGKGKVYEKPDGAYCDVKFNLDIEAARDWYSAIKFDYENPPSLAQYSYGYNVLPGGSKSGQHQGRQVRFLQPRDDGSPGVEVFEVGSVMLGAGTDTRTVSVKGRNMRSNRAEPSTTTSRAVKGAIPSHETKTVSRAWDRIRTENALPDDARPSELRTVYAWVDPDGDPELKSSYRFAHHHGIGGPANLRAALMGIAALNGPDGQDMPEAERKGIYDHLAGHLRDADREIPDLRTGPGDRKNRRFHDEAADVLASVGALIDRASEVMAMRRTKGRAMAASTSDLLGWVSDELVRLKHLMSNPVEPQTPQPDDDEIASVVAASIARLNGI